MAIDLRKVSVEKGSTLVFLLSLLLAWQVWLLVFLFLGLVLLPAQRQLLGGGIGNYMKAPWWWAWANFDGEHYLLIAQHGYSALNAAFFPVYPFLVRWFGGVGQTQLEALLRSGLFVSHVSLFLGLVLFYRLVKLDYKEKVARWSVIALLSAPTAFYLGAVYTESLFLMLAVGSFYAARKGRWGGAGILGAVASGTRVVGVAVVVGLAAEWLWQRSREKRGRWKDLVGVAISPLGLLAYMRYAAMKWQDALAFVHIQPAFGAGRSTDKVVLLYQVFWRYARMVVTVEPASWAYYTLWLEAAAAVLFLVLLVIAFFKLRWSYFAFMAVGYLLPTLTGTFSSMPRYMLLLFPGIILLGQGLARYKAMRWVYLPLVIVWLGVNCALFTRGIWVG